MFPFDDVILVNNLCYLPGSYIVFQQRNPAQGKSEYVGNVILDISQLSGMCFNLVNICSGLCLQTKIDLRKYDLKKVTAKTMAILVRALFLLTCIIKAILPLAPSLRELTCQKQIITLL